MSQPKDAGAADKPFSVRTALLLTIALLVGALGGALAYAQTLQWPSAIVAGLVAAAAALAYAHKHIEPS